MDTNASRVKTRSSNMELLRILAMLMIVSHHYMAHGGLDMTVVGTSPLDVFNQFVYLGGKLGVTIFVLLTGYFQVTGRFKPAKLFLLLAQVAFYSLILYAVALGLGWAAPTPAELLRDLYQSLFAILYGKYWFVSAYFCLYLVSPFLNRLIRTLNQRELLTLVLAGLVGISILPTFFFTNTFFADTGLGFIFLYCLGAFLRLYPPRRLPRPTFLFAVSGGLYLILVAFMSLILPFARQFFSTFGKYRDALWREYSPLVLAIAILLLLGFSGLSIQSRTINRVASLTLGVYLLHDNFYMQQNLWHQLEVPSHLTIWQVLWHAPLCILGVYLACSILELARQRLIEPLYAPALTRLADRLTARFNTWRRQP